MARRVHTGKNVSEGLMLFYKMRILSVGPPSCSNLYLESSYPRRDLMPSPCRIKPLQLVPGQEHGAEAMAGSGPGAAAALHASDYSGPLCRPTRVCLPAPIPPPTSPWRGQSLTLSLRNQCRKIPAAAISPLFCGCPGHCSAQSQRQRGSMDTR